MGKKLSLILNTLNVNCLWDIQVKMSNLLFHGKNCCPDHVTEQGVLLAQGDNNRNKDNAHRLADDGMGG